MRRIAPFVVACIASIACANAAAAESVHLAERGGFLLGSAFRCGVEPVRLVEAAKTIGALIAAAATDDGEAETAKSQFASFLVTSARSKAAGRTSPVCTTVVAEFEKLERHPAPSITR